jgi:methyltransferase (TIGR00027 family)
MRSGQPSQTAVAIAAEYLYLALDPRYAVLVPRRAAVYTRILLETIGPDARWYVSLLHQCWFRAQHDLYERMVAPGITLYLGLRKRFIEAEVRAAIASGIQQVIVFGAGFDTLGARLAEDHPGFPCFEIDHPNTQRCKRAGLQRLPGTRPSLHLVPLDLSQARLEDVLLAQPAYRPEVRSMFVAEGLLEYLAAEHVDRLLRFVGQQSAPGSRLAFSFVEAHPDGSPDLGCWECEILSYLELLGEPCLWGIQRTQLAAFLEHWGLRLCQQPGTVELCYRFLAMPLGMTPTVSTFEYLATAESR